MFSDMKIGMRLALSFGAIVLLMLITAAISQYGLKTIDDNVEVLVKDKWPKAVQADAITDEINVIARAIRNMLLTDDKSVMQKERTRITEASARITSDYHGLEKSARSEEGKVLLMAFNEARIPYVEEISRLMSLIEAGDKKAALALLLGRFPQLQDAYFRATTDLVRYQSSEMDRTGKKAVDTCHRVSLIIYLLSAVCVVLATAVAWLVTRSITRPIAQAVDISNRVAAGDMSMEIAIARADETGLLLSAMKKMSKIIKALVDEVDMLAKAAVAGKLATRADVSKHQGDFREILEGVNATISRLVGLLDNMPAPAMIVDNDFNVLYINEQGAKLGGKSPAQVVGTKCYDHFKTSDCKSRNCACGRVMQSGLAVQGETDAHPAVGVDLDIAYSAMPLRDEAGQTAGAFVVVSDQTEIKNLARQKDQLMIQQNRMAAMGEMLGNIAHQWRQPLNILGLQVQELLISYRLGQFSEDLLDTGVAKAMEVIQHMSQTIDDFRDFLVLDKEKKLFKVDPVIRKSVSLIEGSLKKHNIRLDISHTGDPQINGHPNEYGQVILNILMNAKDALVEKGKSDATIMVRSWTEQDRAVVTITDNAGGIEDEIIDRIFDAYFTTKPLGKGTGVGLFMSKTIIEKSMGGRLSVRNVEGGAQFRIEV